MKIIVFLFLFFSFLIGYSQNNKVVRFYFNTNESEVSKNELTKLSVFLNNVSVKEYTSISVIAYTDTVGSVSFNHELAFQRAKSISTLLKNKELEIDSILIIGENYPTGLPNNYKLKEWRRVDVIFSIPSNDQNSKEESIVIQSNQKIDLTNNKFQKFLQTAKSDQAIDLNVQFYGGTADMLPNSSSEIDDLYDFLVSNKQYSALIRGHVCCHDDMPLSVQRANVVYQILVSKGITPNRIDFKGYSNSQPVVSPEISEEDRQKNRRVDVIFSK